MTRLAGMLSILCDVLHHIIKQPMRFSFAGHAYLEGLRNFQQLTPLRLHSPNLVKYMIIWKRVPHCPLSSTSS